MSYKLPAYTVSVPEDLQKYFGKPKGDTKLYYREGGYDEAKEWFDALNLFYGAVVALPSVSLLVPVSRNSIHIRVKEGKLSCFQFKTQEHQQDISQSLNRERPHSFVPIVECLAWLQEFKDRLTMRSGHIPATNYTMIQPLMQRGNIRLRRDFERIGELGKSGLEAHYPLYFAELSSRLEQKEKL